MPSVYGGDGSGFDKAYDVATRGCRTNRLIGEIEGDGNDVDVATVNGEAYLSQTGSETIGYMADEAVAEKMEAARNAVIFDGSFEDGGEGYDGLLP